jgi:hypothetical protein
MDSLLKPPAQGASEPFTDSAEMDAPGSGSRFTV